MTALTLSLVLMQTSAAPGCDAIAAGPRNNAGALTQAGVCEYEAARYPAAEQAFRAAIAQDANFAGAYTGLGAALVAGGKAEQAILVLRQALKLAPGDPMSLRSLAHAYQKANRFFEGEKALRALVASDAADWESWYYLGALLYENNLYPSAREALETSLRLQPGNLRAHILRASTLAALGLTPDAEAAFSQLNATPAAAGDPEMLLGYAQLLFGTQRPAPALELLERALQSAPDSSKLHFWRARLLLETGKAEEAYAAATRAVGLAPDLPQARNLLLRIARELGRLEDVKRQAAWLREFETKRSGP